VSCPGGDSRPGVLVLRLLYVFVACEVDCDLCTGVLTLIVMYAVLGTRVRPEEAPGSTVPDPTHKLARFFSCARMLFSGLVPLYMCLCAAECCEVSEVLCA
jgi:hypothetical protein